MGGEFVKVMVLVCYAMGMLTLVERYGLRCGLMTCMHPYITSKQSK
jgi:hypothetical protein